MGSRHAPRSAISGAPASAFPPSSSRLNAKKGFVDHTQFDTSSILSTIEQRFNLAPLVPLRDGVAPTLADALTDSQITRGAFVLNSRTKKFTQSVTIANLGTTPLVGPVQLVLDNLSATTALSNATGTTTSGQPLYHPSARVTWRRARRSLSSCQFNVPASGGITYNARTVSGINP